MVSSKAFDNGEMKHHCVQNMKLNVIFQVNSLLIKALDAVENCECTEFVGCNSCELLISFIVERHHSVAIDHRCH